MHVLPLLSMHYMELLRRFECGCAWPSRDQCMVQTATIKAVECSREAVLRT